jgi:hypothetical protein
MLSCHIGYDFLRLRWIHTSLDHPMFMAIMGNFLQVYGGAAETHQLLSLIDVPLCCSPGR